ncbi:glycosyltransferase family 4 protein [Spiribacter sp. SSL99]|uniref:glycosyltransferase family 4 protein n=1 Tax=Spiribacter sp. SSL99 TaxID=1866884 RepID=UPI00351A7317
MLHLCLSQSWGGLEMYPARVTPELQRQGWAVHGMALAGTRVADAFKAVGVEPLTVGSRPAALLQLPRILRYLDRHDIRVVHAHKSSDMQVAALLAQRRPGLRLFFTDHMGVKKPKKDLYHRWAYAKARRVFSISQATQQWNRAALPVPAERLVQLYYGIDLQAHGASMSDQRRREMRRSLGVDDQAVVIALPGRVTRSKGHLVWVEALRRLNERPGLPHWQGVVVGEASGADARPGGFADELRATVEREGLTHRVVFAGFRRDLATCLQAVDIACIPSEREAFGLSVIESMAADCAVVGAASGAIPELIDQDRGRVADPADPGAWTAALAELVADADLRVQLAAAGREWVNARFTLAEHVERLVGYYRG